MIGLDDNNFCMCVFHPLVRYFTMLIKPSAMFIHYVNK